MHGTRALTRLVLLLALGLSGLAGAASGPEPAAGPAARPGESEAAAAAAGQASAPTPAEPDQAQIDAWLAAGRALKAERPELFGGAEGVLVTEVLPDGQGAGAGIAPGDVLIAHGDSPLVSADQLIALTRETPAAQTLALRWLRPDAQAGVRVLEAQIHGGRIGVGVLDLAENLVALLDAFRQAGWAARERARFDEALGLLEQGLELARASGETGWRGGFQTLIGTVLADIGRYTDAVEHHVAALEAFREVGNRLAEASALTNLGLTLSLMGRYADAIEHHTRAVAIFRGGGKRASEGTALGNLGIVYEKLGHYPEALEHYSQALAVSREIGDRAGEGANRAHLGTVNLRLGRYREALDHLTQALAIRREVGDRPGEVDDIGNLGVVYARLGRYTEALGHLNQVLAIDRERGDRSGEGATLGNLGAVYWSMGRYARAIEHHFMGLAIARETGDRAGEAGALGNLGVAYDSLGRYPEALEYHYGSLAIHRELGDRSGEAADLGNLGNVLLKLGRYHDAIERHGQALSIHRHIGDKGAEATDLGNLGLVYASLGKVPESLEHYNGALAIRREIGDRAGEGRDLSNLGVAYFELGRYLESREHYTNALRVRREIGDRAGESTDLLNLGVLNVAEGYPSAAVEQYQRSLVLQAELNQPETLWRLWDNLRQLWQGNQRPVPAILAGKRAVNIIQEMRLGQAKPEMGQALAREQQQSFLADKEFVYRGLADLLIAQGRHAEAQQVLDMLKEQELYDYIQEEGAHDPRQTRVGLNAMEGDWSQAYDAAAAPAPALAERLGALTRIQPEARTEAEQAEIDRLTAERDALGADLQRQLAALPEHFAAIDPARQAAEDRRFAEAPDTKRALLAALSKRSGQPTGLLQFILLDDKVRLLLTTPEGWHTAVVEVDAATLNSEIDALRTALTKPALDATTPARALYTRLVAPIDEAIDAAGIQSLLVHLDGRLRYIPFAALNDGERWLAERWSLVYYTAASERQPEAAGGGGNWRVAGLGVSEKREGFDALPAVEQEIKGIVREGGADPNGVLPGRALLNAAFSESALKAEAANTDNGILHIASHFSLRPGSDADSSLLLGTLAADGAPDTLSLKALRESDPPLDLRHLDLVALSACNTFLGGADESGVEIEGMGAIIQRQGARGVLASLWPVADASTGVLMQTFYGLRAERPDLTKAQALQAAQLALLHRDPATGTCASDRSPLVVSGGTQAPAAPADPSACRWSHPYYWAPFVLMGNWL